MPQPKKGARLGGSPAHQKLILSNLATALFEHGRITTTEAKARALRPVAERLITKAKKAELGTVESLHNRRLVLRTVRDKGVVHTLFTEIAPRYTERPGGYTRITKIGPRKGDNAPMALIEIVTESVADSKKANARVTAPAKKASPRRAAPAATAPAEESPAEELVSDTEDLDESTEAEQAPSDDTSDEEAKEYGEGSYRGVEPPAGFDIKGNEDSMKFHTTESQWYEQTIAEVWFDSEKAAEAAGFTKAG